LDFGLNRKGWNHASARFRTNHPQRNVADPKQQACDVKIRADW
jgi:hypothetical protein